MSFTRVKPGGYVVNDLVTSSELNGLDIDHANALDKTAAGDTLSGRVACSGAGRLVSSRVIGADADTTYTANGGNTRIFVTSLTANRAYTLSTTGAVTGDVVQIVVADAVTFLLSVKQSSTTIAMMGGATTATISSGANYTAAAVQKEATFVYDGTNWVIESATRIKRSLTITANGTFVVPPGVYRMGCFIGGGGGGAGGVYTGGNQVSAAGNGALVCYVEFSTTPGETLTNVIGAGGSAGSNGTPGVNGGDGGASTITNGSSVVVAYGPGGSGGIASTASAPGYAGSSPIKGGLTGVGANGQAGDSSGWAQGGTGGLNSSGGGGGGGGAGFGPGANGASGLVAGASAAANSSAGGAAAFAQNPGAGGSGRIILIWS